MGLPVHMYIINFFPPVNLSYIPGKFWLITKKVEEKLFFLPYKFSPCSLRVLEWLKDDHCKSPEAFFMPSSLEILGGNISLRKVTGIELIGIAHNTDGEKKVQVW